MRRRFFSSESKVEFNTNNYLTIEALEDGLTVKFFPHDIEYGIDGIGWSKLRCNISTPPINAGQTISFRGELSPGESSSNYWNDSKGIGTFAISKRCNLEGNCMSLLFGDNAVDNFSLNGKNCAFDELFYNNKNIVSADKLILPATTLADSCYSNMFDGCTSLVKAPELPATTLANSCYREMFYNCTSLTNAPSILPANTLASACYYEMFYKCRSLITAPTLPATTLADGCYSSMFYGCSSLTTAPVLPATTLADGCYSSMFYNCTSLTTAPSILPATTLASSCYRYMFFNCTSLTSAPELPATTLARLCYADMFQYCTSLNYIKMLATDISASSCLNRWVDGVASSGTFVKNADMDDLPTATINNSYAGIPRSWTVKNA